MYKTINEIAKMEECSSISSEISNLGFTGDMLVKAKKDKWGNYIVERTHGLMNISKSGLAFPRFLAYNCKFCEKENEICNECDPVWDFGK